MSFTPSNDIRGVFEAKTRVIRCENKRDTKRTGGEGGIRTPGTGENPYNGLASRRNRPLCHLSAEVQITVNTGYKRRGALFPALLSVRGLLRIEQKAQDDASQYGGEDEYGG